MFASRCAFAGFTLGLSMLLASAHDAAAQGAKGSPSTPCSKTNKSAVQPGTVPNQQFNTVNQPYALPGSTMPMTAQHAAHHHHHHQDCNCNKQSGQVVFPGQSGQYPPMANGGYPLPGQQTALTGQQAYLFTQPYQTGTNQNPFATNYPVAGQQTALAGQQAYLFTQPYQTGTNQPYPVAGQQMPLNGQPAYLFTQPYQMGMNQPNRVAGQQMPLNGQPAYLFTQPYQQGFNPSQPIAYPNNPVAGQLQQVQPGYPQPMQTNVLANQKPTANLQIQTPQGTPWLIQPGTLQNQTYTGTNANSGFQAGNCNCNKQTGMTSQTVSSPTANFGTQNAHAQHQTKSNTSAAAQHGCPPHQTQATANHGPTHAAHGKKK